MSNGISGIAVPLVTIVTWFMIHTFFCHARLLKSISCQTLSSRHLAPIRKLCIISYRSDYGFRVLSLKLHLWITPMGARVTQNSILLRESAAQNQSIIKTRCWFMICSEIPDLDKTKIACDVKGVIKSEWKYQATS